MKTLIALLGTTVFVCGSQVALSNQAPLRPTTASNSYNENYRGLMGACCLPDGSCVMEYATQCYSSWGGAYMGGDCSDNPCDALIGACCAGGTCEVVSQADCGNGSFMGGGVDCSDVSCELAWSGACCYGEGGCEIMDSMQCMEMEGTSYYYLSCEQVSCPIPCPPSPPTDEIMFSSIAYPLSIECGAETLGSYINSLESPNAGQAIRIDLDGDHSEEYIIEYASYTISEMHGESNNRGALMQSGSTNGAIKTTELIDLNPSLIVYTGMLFSCENISCGLIGFFDVTGDSLPDAIVSASTDSMPSSGCGHGGFYYVENISIPPAAACATDINNDGSTNVTDLLAVVGNWGECE